MDRLLIGQTPQPPGGELKLNFQLISAFNPPRWAKTEFPVNYWI